MIFNRYISTIIVIFLGVFFSQSSIAQQEVVASFTKFVEAAKKETQEKQFIYGSGNKHFNNLVNLKVARFDVKKSDSLINPYTAIVEFSILLSWTPASLTYNGASAASDFGRKMNGLEYFKYPGEQPSTFDGGSTTYNATIDYGYTDGKWSLKYAKVTSQNNATREFVEGAFRDPGIDHGPYEFMRPWSMESAPKINGNKPIQDRSGAKYQTYSVNKQDEKDENLRLLRVLKSKENTVFEMEYVGRKSGNIGIFPPGHRESFLVQDLDSGQIFNLTDVEGMKIRPEQTKVIPGKSYRFNLIFDPMTARRLNLIEGRDKASAQLHWRFQDVELIESAELFNRLIGKIEKLKSDEDPSFDDLWSGFSLSEDAEERAEDSKSWAKKLTQPSAIAYTMGLDGRMQVGVAAGLESQDKSDQVALEKCTQAAKAENITLPCAVVYRSRKTDVAAFLRLVDAGKSVDFDAWAAGVNRSLTDWKRELFQ